LRFWDASALVPLCLAQPRSEVMRSLLQEDPDIVVWWGSVVECWSAFARAVREGRISLQVELQARAELEALREAWDEIQPVEDVRDVAGRLLRIHALRAADALQLAAAIVWAGGRQTGFVCLDDRLREVARLEGFIVYPTP
jgi:predicted nucleic acid-binding protein